MDWPKLDDIWLTPRGHIRIVGVHEGTHSTAHGPGRWCTVLAQEKSNPQIKRVHVAEIELKSNAWCKVSAL